MAIEVRIRDVTDADADRAGSPRPGGSVPPAGPRPGAGTLLSDPSAPHPTGPRPAPRTATTPTAEPSPLRPHPTAPPHSYAGEGPRDVPGASVASVASGGPGPSGQPPSSPSRPAHRDTNVLRWLTAYFASIVGDSVYFLSLIHI